MLDQAEYLNDAVSYILSLYHNSHRSNRDPDLPDPSSVIIIGHSMGGIVARTMLTMPNYQPNSVNTILTLSAPHARPPVSFDADIVQTYRQINSYWREAYSQQWASDNPLWHVTLISIAGGGLDTVVPSDYASLSSLVPETHGFTVFTSTIPDVWTGMDHLAITWCDQLRKSVIRAVMDVVDATRSTQTRPRATRMRTFRKRFLTGMEENAEKSLAATEPKTILDMQDSANSYVTQGERLTLRRFGHHEKAKVNLLPVPPQGDTEGRKFTLLSDRQIVGPDEAGDLEVLFCSVFPLEAGNSGSVFSLNMDFSGDSSGSTRLACKSAAADVIKLPQSKAQCRFASDDGDTFSYLQYDVEDLVEHQFVAVVDKASQPTDGFAIAEYTSTAESVVTPNLGLARLLTSGLHLKLPSRKPLVTSIRIPALHSALLAYNLRLQRRGSSESGELFTPLLRQHISDVYESKYFVNVQPDDEINISLHGVAPYLPPPFKRGEIEEGLTLQIWSDPNLEGPLEVSLEVDLLGSMGKLWMRYRTIFAAFPLLVVALVFRKQFKIYDETGVFMSFSESMNQCLRTSLPVLYTALTCLAISLAKSSHDAARGDGGLVADLRGNATEGLVDYSKNGLLLGSQDTFFWFLVPFFGLVCSGVCIAVNYAVMALTHLLSLIPTLLRQLQRRDDMRRPSPNFSVTSTRQRLITTSILLFLVSTVIPYQFAYLVLCIVQLVTCVRALKIARESVSSLHLLFLMIC
jgi:GPI inositol-deacylase